MLCEGNYRVNQLLRVFKCFCFKRRAHETRHHRNFHKYSLRICCMGHRLKQCLPVKVKCCMIPTIVEPLITDTLINGHLQ
jgi:hypothetical protein